MNHWRSFLVVVGVAGLTVWPLRGEDQVPGAGWEYAQVWLEQDGAMGDWFGVRTTLLDHGVEVFGGYTVDVWGNTSGGIKTGTVYTGLLDFGVNVDLEKSIGWSGASLNTTWLWLSGRDASEDLTGNFLTVSNIAGFNTLRMLTLWFQQNVWEDRISLRFGQLAADEEFLISDYSGLFLNGTFGWPAVTSLNLPEGRTRVSDGHAWSPAGADSGRVVHVPSGGVSGKCLRPGREPSWLPLADGCRDRVHLSQ